jgi:hypothetical protein
VTDPDRLNIPLSGQGDPMSAMIKKFQEVTVCAGFRSDYFYRAGVFSEDFRIFTHGASRAHLPDKRCYMFIHLRRQCLLRW